jgi:ABC-type transport system involved in multi-copper enzyme maturation permease subunit
MRLLSLLKGTTMNGLRNIRVLMCATYTEGIRHRVLQIIFGVALMVSLANIGVTGLFSWDIGKVTVEFGLSAVSICGLLTIFFLAMKLLADDLERGRIFMFMSRPISIGQYLVGRFLGLSLILGLATIVVGLCAAASVFYILHYYAAWVPPNFSWLTFSMAMVSQFLSLVVILSVSMLCFSLASNGFLAIMLTFGIYLVGQNMELLRRVVVENPYSGLLMDRSDFVVALSWVFPNLSLFDKKYVAAYGMMFSGTELALLTLYCFSYATVMLACAVALYRRKEMT